MESLTQFLHYTASFIIVLSVIVFIHEYGHYIVAKLSGIKIEVFSIGFGKELVGWNDKSGTRWKISLLPLGGYVKMFGDIDPASAPDTEKINHFTEEERKIAFHTKPLGIKAAVVAAGPIANFLLAIVLMTFFFSFLGKPTNNAQINVVMAGSAAEAAGLKDGDLITHLDGITVKTFTDVQRMVALNTGTPIAITFQREGVEATITVTPTMHERQDIFGNTVKSPMLGISSTSITYEKLNVPNAFTAAIVETYNISASTLTAIGQMLIGQRSPKEISGPIGIAKYSGQSAEKGIETLLWFITVLSINLGLINLFPIPVLDGGHLLYYAVEAIRGKPMADRIQQIGFKIGIALVATLAIFAIINDLRNLKLF